MQDVYSERPNLYIGFHGCERKEGMRLLTEPNTLSPSTRNHEWLGHGFYVWENNIERALDWAKNHRPNPYKEPFVIGVVYTLGNCMDLTDKHFIDLLSDDYPRFVEDLKWIRAPIPQNTNPDGSPNPRGLLRKLDCSLIEHLHATNEAFDPMNNYDTVRGAFSEGIPAYPGTQFGKKDHIQVCIRNENCVKGFFLPRKYKS